MTTSTKADPARVSRGMASYLVLPRPGDVGKAVIIPLAYGVGLTLTSSPSPHDLLRAVVVWFAVEYLAYQARYQWNDIRGFSSDQLHPDRATRGRLPGPPERGRRHVGLSTAVAWARVAGAVLLILALPSLHLAGILLPSVAAVFAVAALYERVRAGAGGCEWRERPTGACVRLWLVSGGGYCVRGLTGIVLAGGGQIPPARLVCAAVACWFAGTLFVTARWAVESLPFASRGRTGLIWTAPARAGRGHLLALSHWLAHGSGAAPADLRRWRPMWVRRPWHAPWNLAMLVALPAAWLAGSDLTARPVAVDVGFLAAVGGAAALLIRTPAVRTGVVVAAGLSVLAAAGGRFLEAVPAVVVCVLYLVCVHQCLDEVGTLLSRRLRPLLAAMARPGGAS